VAKFAKSVTMNVGDERPILTMYVTNEETGAVVNLSSAISCKFFMYPVGENEALGTVKVNGVAGAISGGGTTGIVTYTWATADVNTAGRYIGWFVIYWGATSTVPQTTTAVEITFKAIGERRS